MSCAICDILFNFLNVFSVWYIVEVTCWFSTKDKASSCSYVRHDIAEKEFVDVKGLIRIRISKKNIHCIVSFCDLRLLITPFVYSNFSYTHILCDRK